MWILHSYSATDPYLAEGALKFIFRYWTNLNPKLEIAQQLLQQIQKV